MLLALVVLAIAGCKKDENTKDLLTAHAWKFDKVTTTSTSQAVQDALDDTYATFMDGVILTYKPDGTYTFNKGSYTTTGVYELVDMKLTMDKGTEDEMAGTIGSISASKMTFETSEAVLTGDDTKYPVTYCYIK